MTKARKSAGPDLAFTIHLWGLHLLAVFILGLALTPMVAFLASVWRTTAGHALLWRALAFSLSLSVGYFLFGLALIFLCVAAKNLFGFRIKPGLFPMYSKESYSWMGYSALILLANAAFLDVLRISPFQMLFYRAMGGKFGKDIQVNTGGLADLSMLEIGDNVVIGGGVALICHAFERGFLRLAPTKIGANVSIGLSSVIMPGCEIGEGASIAPCTYLPKGTQVPSRGHWGGNPARDLRAERRAELAAEG